jgi:hypothetical protein
VVCSDFDGILKYAKEALGEENLTVKIFNAVPVGKRNLASPACFLPLKKLKAACPDLVISPLAAPMQSQPEAIVSTALNFDTPPGVSVGGSSGLDFTTPSNAPLRGQSGNGGGSGGKSSVSNSGGGCGSGKISVSKISVVDDYLQILDSMLHQEKDGFVPPPDFGRARAIVVANLAALSVSAKSVREGQHPSKYLFDKQGIPIAMCKTQSEIRKYLSRTRRIWIKKITFKLAGCRTRGNLEHAVNLLKLRATRAHKKFVQMKAPDSSTPKSGSNVSSTPKPGSNVSSTLFCSTPKSGSCVLLCCGAPIRVKHVQEMVIFGQTVVCVAVRHNDGEMVEISGHLLADPSSDLPSGQAT